MSLPRGHEPVDDDELLYRRVPVSKNWYTSSGLSPEAFDPRKNETTGISVSRAKYMPVELAAKGPAKQGYYVAVLRAGDLRAAGIDVVPRPEPDNPAHAELPGLTCNNRLEDIALERKVRLAALAISIEGPFVPPPQLSEDAPRRP